MQLADPAAAYRQKLPDWSVAELLLIPGDLHRLRHSPNGRSNRVRSCRGRCASVPSFPAEHSPAIRPGSERKKLHYRNASGPVPEVSTSPFAVSLCPCRSLLRSQEMKAVIETALLQRNDAK